MKRSTTIASKDILARAMAMENITVDHCANAPTAAFNTKERRLILPVWEDMDDSMYDMLVGHEVSHALHTPASGWESFVGQGSGSTVRHMFLNIIEDARIERMIKIKFPGLRRDFASAYKTLHSRDIFKIVGKDLAALPLIDRLNLHFKLGLFGLETIPFTAEEIQYVTRMSDTETFSEVQKLAEDLYGLYKDEEENKADEDPGQGSGTPPFSESGDSGGMDEKGENDAGTDDCDAPEENSSEGTDESASSDQNGNDSGESLEDDTDDGESADSADGDSAAADTDDGLNKTGLKYDDYSTEGFLPGATQSVFEQNIDDLRDVHADEYQYFTIPNAELDAIVIDFTGISEIWNKHTEGKWSADHGETHIKSNEDLRKFQNSIKPTVTQMVQIFQMKQAAAASKRTDIARSGVLDTSSMINYRWSEDIFVKNEIHADGKSHGMIIYVDWSGSMSGILKDTIEQLLLLVEFCRKVNIPFEVYAFSSVSTHWGDTGLVKPEKEQWKSNGLDTDCTPHNFHLLNFLSSRMNNKQNQEATNYLWLLVNSIAPGMGCSYWVNTPHEFRLGSTPLNETIVAAMQQVPAFQKDNDIEIVNTVFLTDGDGNDIFNAGWHRNNIIRDVKTRKTYQMPKESYTRQTDALLSMLRDRTHSNLIGIRLHNRKTIAGVRYGYGSGDIAAAGGFDEKKINIEFKKNNFVNLPSAYDEFFVVRGDLAIENDALSHVPHNASHSQLKNAFMKGSSRKKSSRVIATKMVEIFANATCV